MTIGRGRERPEKRPPKYRWIIPAVAIVAALIVIAAIVDAVVHGIRLF
ncbi:MAG: hypothetical protein QOF36_1543 [Microbacteriaceae bacterium]|jgi:hypothetical protein|nr:hypothetical protein [Microbacteriaceae bacterium]